MGQVFVPGLRVADYAIVRKKRILPIRGNVLVKKGDDVKSSTIVARTSLPGNVRTLNIANILGISPDDIRHYMLKKEGEMVELNEPIAETKPIIKWLKTKIRSPIKGTIETISEVTGQVLLREPAQILEITAYVDGKIVEIYEGEGAVVETRATFIQGIFGIGGEMVGKLVSAVKNPDDVLTPDNLKPEYKDCIVVGGAFAGYETFLMAKKLGIRGIIVGSVHDKHLRSLLGYDLGVAITGTEKIGFTLIVTEGFGNIQMAKKTFELLLKNENQKASISGATQIRAGVIRPEVIIPKLELQKDNSTKEEGKQSALKEGDVVRIIRDPLFGKIGKVKALPNELVEIATETKVRILEVELLDGTNVIIPRSNVEIIEK